MHDCYSLAFLLRIFGLVRPTRLIFLAMGKRCFVMGSIVLCSFPVTEGAARHVLIVAIKDNKIGSVPT